jgi:hypothetical protein
VASDGEQVRAAVLGHGAEGRGRPSRDDLDLGRRDLGEQRGGVVARLLRLLLELSGGVRRLESRLRREPEVERDDADELALRRSDRRCLAQGLETVG